IIVYAAAENQSMNTIAISQCLRKGLKKNQACTLAADVAIGASISKFALSVGRKHASPRIANRDMRLKYQVHPAGQNHGALTQAETLATQVNGDKGRRARGIHRHTRAAKVKSKKKQTRGAVT